MSPSQNCLLGSRSRSSWTPSLDGQKASQIQHAEKCSFPLKQFSPFQNITLIPAHTKSTPFFSYFPLAIPPSCPVMLAPKTSPISSMISPFLKVIISILLFITYFFLYIGSHISCCTMYTTTLLCIQFEVLPAVAFIALSKLLIGPIALIHILGSSTPHPVFILYLRSFSSSPLVH